MHSVGIDRRRALLANMLAIVYAGLIMILKGGE